MTSKLEKADAQEWLESLQQVGEGWWRQVGLAIRAGAPKVLGLTRRDFAAAIGQRMVDPREAIVELHQQGHSQTEIAEILGVSRDRTVAVTLAEAGLIDPSPNTKAKVLKSGLAEPDAKAKSGPVEPDSAQLQAEIDRLTLKAKGDEAKRKREVADLKEKMAQLRKDVTEEKRRLRDEAQDELTEQERERALREAEAWANEQGAKILTGVAKLAVDHVVGALKEAADDMRLLVEHDAVSATAIKKIEAAYGEFIGEFDVARMAVQGR